MAVATGQSKLELVPASENTFLAKEVNAQVTFMKDEAGKVTALILNQNGQKTSGKKIR